MASSGYGSDGMRGDERAQAKCTAIAAFLKNGKTLQGGLTALKLEILGCRKDSNPSYNYTGVVPMRIVGKNRT
jgi:hypothetical protein